MNQSKKMALGGVLAALAVVVMSLGGLIPVATFVCPMLCMILLRFVCQLCGNRIGWAWYGAVAVLSFLLGSDKEAAAVFLFLGFYPIVKPKLDTMKVSWLLKLLLFNTAIGCMYYLLIHLLGMAQIAAEYAQMGTVLTVIMLLLGNLTFYLLDLVLTRLNFNKKQGRR